MSTQLQLLAKFIAFHGFPAAVIGDRVHFSIPYAVNGSPAGSQLVTASNLREARALLGY